MLKYGWSIGDNRLFYHINVHHSLKGLFVGYLHHRFRILHTNRCGILVPKQWKFEENEVVLYFSTEILNKIKKGEKPSRIKTIDEYTTWKRQELIPLIKVALFCFDQRIYNFCQFGIINGKIIASPLLFIKGHISKDEISKLKNRDILFLTTYIHNKTCEIIDSLSSDDRQFIKNLLDYLKRDDKINDIYLLIENTYIENPASFLDLFLQAEIFYKIREIYKFKQFFNAEKRGIIRAKGEIVLEIDRFYEDRHFNKLIRPTPQELWDELIEERKVTRELVITPLDEFPNPFINRIDGKNLVEWVKVHTDHPLIHVKARQDPKYFPRSGYLFVFDFGEADLIQKKRRFIEFVNNSEMVQDLLKKPVPEKNNFENKISRQRLVRYIIDNSGLFTVQGPPGTGKTHLATEVVCQLIKERPDVKILISAKEHLALDHILMTITKKLKRENIAFRAYRSLSLERLKQRDHDPEISHFLKSEVIREIAGYRWKPGNEIWQNIQNSLIKEGDLRNQSIAQESATLFFCTTMDRAFYDILYQKSFDLVVLEEAGKCYPTELFHLLPLGQNVLLIGDQNQLPPYKIRETEEAIEKWQSMMKKVIHNKYFQEELRVRFGSYIMDLLNFFKREGRISPEKYAWLKPFECLFNLLPDDKKFILDEQYRMEKELSNVIGRVFYDKEFKHKKQLKKSFRNIIPKKLDVPLLWIDTPHCTLNPDAGEDPEKSGERINYYELDVLLKYLESLEPAKKIDLVILTPYKDQKLIFLESKKLTDLCIRLTKEKCSEIVKTIDEYQGQEADITILSLVRNNTLASKASWGFMTVSERLNVMFSRASFRQVVIGCSEHVKRNKDDEEIQILVKLLKEYEKEGIFIEAEKFKNEKHE